MKNPGQDEESEDGINEQDDSCGHQPAPATSDKPPRFEEQISACHLTSSSFRLRGTAPQFAAGTIAASVSSNLSGSSSIASPAWQVSHCCPIFFFRPSASVASRSRSWQRKQPGLFTPSALCPRLERCTFQPSFIAG